LATMDAITEWTNAQARVIELVESLNATEAQLPVPSCPAWTVHDLLAHVVGLDADVLAGDEPDDHNPNWTQAQVDRRSAHDIAAIVAEWRTMTDPMTAWMSENGTRPLGDVIIHEQDLRGAVRVSGAQDNAGLAALRSMMADGFATKVGKAGLGPVALIGSSWTFNTSDEPPALTVQASDFDLTRALMSRRSEAQLRSWTTSGDIADYLPLFAALGSLPEKSLSE
jgi:uncharacterized protein (TIGR03083 family)